MSLPTDPPARRIPGPPCSVASAAARLSPAELVTLAEWLSTPVGAPGRRTNPEVADELTRETGVPVSFWSVGSHRRGRCRCFR